MPTKLSRYAEGVMEAAWLAAIVFAPLFFDKYSSRIFEPDKATLLRTLALIMACAWIVKLIDERLNRKNNSVEPVSPKTILRIPLVIPMAALAAVYIIATVFSVAPRISFWGSYQRLQGLYTTSAYLILFATLVGNLRRKAQVERVITTAILTSLPISLYGVLQHYGIDPVPWGGDVTRRVASHMGNPIFVAAYLILVFPLTIGRIVDSFKKILSEAEGIGQQTARSTVYIFIAALQLIAIFFSQSRGPWLGFFSGGFFLFVLLSLYWKKRWLTFSSITFALIAAAFLVVLNIPNGPLQNLNEMDAFRRLGQLLDTQSRTARVRSLIWGGAAEMVMPHDPLVYPDGHTDPFNFIRPLIGYGPEAMHMAYNPFYPPELAYVESRNASPDRSHNETWDSLVFTGLFGLIAYLGVFTTVFYYGLKWVGMIASKRQQITFFVIFGGSGLVSAVSFAYWQGVAFAGLGLPFGLILGLMIYLALIALFSKGSSDQPSYDPARSLTLIVLLAAVISHFAEINFGISIVSTKTYFFAYAALIVSVGYLLPKFGEYSLQASDQAAVAIEKPRSRRRSSRTRQVNSQSEWKRTVLIGGILAAFFLLPMNFEYIANLWGITSTAEVLWTSLTKIEQNVVSYGVLILMITTWLAACTILTSESSDSSQNANWWKSFGSILGISGAISLFYALLLSGTLAKIARMNPTDLQSLLNQIASLEGLLTQFYVVLIIGILAFGFFLPKDWPASLKNPSPWGPAIAIGGFILTLWLSVATNLHIITADIAFKMAEPFANSSQWPVANQIYRRAIQYSPDEDYYYLFLGRGLLEEAKAVTDPTEQEKAFLAAESDLKNAQHVNPLNPDHTANLARLNSWWALQAPDDATRKTRGLVSDEYFRQVTTLSPNNARLWNEWAILNLNVLQDRTRAFELLTHSLEIDPKYDWTLGLMGDFYNQQARNADNEEAKQSAFNQAIKYYNQAISAAPNNTSYYFALASAYQGLNDTEMVIKILENSLKVAGENEVWQIEESLIQQYVQLNDIPNALIHAQLALNAAPDSEHERLNNIINQLTSSP